MNVKSIIENETAKNRLAAMVGLGTALQRIGFERTGSQVDYAWENYGIRGASPVAHDWKVEVSRVPEAHDQPPGYTVSAALTYRNEAGQRGTHFWEESGIPESEVLSYVQRLIAYLETVDPLTAERRFKFEKMQLY